MEYSISGCAICNFRSQVSAAWRRVLRSRIGWSFGRLEIGAREMKELYIPPSQSMRVPKTSKEHALKWVRGVVEGTCVMVADLVMSKWYVE